MRWPPRHFPALPTPPSWLAEVPLAHRGLHGPGVPENTVAAFAAAAAAGVGVELDVRLSRDGVPVVIHDADLGRLTGRPGRVAATHSTALAQRRVAGTAQAVPTLARVLAAVGDAPVMVEVKQDGVGVSRLEPAVAAVLLGHDGPVCVASFNPRSLRWFAAHAARVPRVQTAGPLRDVAIPAGVKWSLRSLRWLRAVRPCAVSYDLDGVDSAVVAAYRQAGGTVVTWTVTDRPGLEWARRFADNVIFERLPVAEVRDR